MHVGEHLISELELSFLKYFVHLSKNVVRKNDICFFPEGINGGIFLPLTYKINYFNMQNNYVYMQDTYVDMQASNLFR